MSVKIKKGDTVKVIAGKDKGAEGKVIQVLREEQRVIVEGVNRVKKHTKVVNQGGRAGNTGGIVTAEAPIHLSNVMVVEGKGTTRLGSKRVEATKRRSDGSTYADHPEHPHLPEVRRRDLMSESMTEINSDQAAEKAAGPRMKARYREEILPALREEFGYANVMQVPGLTKIVVNMGVGEAARDSKLIEGAVRDLTAITGQKPQVTKARKSIAQFKLREGMPIGAHVTLRGDRMWEFLDRLLALALPRIRDFRGLSDRQFDGRGNYTFGLTEQVMFHEIDQDRIDRSRGMDITVVTSATNDDEGRALLKKLVSRSRRATDMAKTGLKVKAARKPKFAVRGYTRCQRCGRPKAVYRKFGLCRICLREMAHRGELPGVTKSSW